MKAPAHSSLRLVFAGLVVLTLFSRFIPHLSNAVPLTALALAAGYYFKGTRLGMIIPIATVFFSDLVLHFMTGGNYGFYSEMPFVYGAYLLISMLGSSFSRLNLVGALAGGVAGSILFFLISNFGVWAVGGIYPMTGTGLAACYAAGLAFYRETYTLLNDIAFTVIFLGVPHLVLRKSLKWA